MHFNFISTLLHSMKDIFPVQCASFAQAFVYNLVYRMDPYSEAIENPLQICKLACILVCTKLVPSCKLTPFTQVSINHSEQKHRSQAPQLTRSVISGQLQAFMLEHRIPTTMLSQLLHKPLVSVHAIKLMLDYRMQAECLLIGTQQKESVTALPEEVIIGNGIFGTY